MLMSIMFFSPQLTNSKATEIEALLQVRNALRSDVFSLDQQQSQHLPPSQSHSPLISPLLTYLSYPPLSYIQRLSVSLSPYLTPPHLPVLSPVIHTAAVRRQRRDGLIARRQRRLPRPSVSPSSGHPPGLHPGGWWVEGVVLTVVVVGLHTFTPSRAQRLFSVASPLRPYVLPI